MAQDNIEPKLDAEGPTAAADESDLFDGPEPTDEEIGQERDLWAESELAAFEAQHDAEQARLNAPAEITSAIPPASASQQLAGRFAAEDQAAAPAQARGRRM